MKKSIIIVILFSLLNFINLYAGNSFSTSLNKEPSLVQKSLVMFKEKILKGIKNRGDALNYNPSWDLLDINRMDEKQFLNLLDEGLDLDIVADFKITFPKTQIGMYLNLKKNHISLDYALKFKKIFEEMDYHDFIKLKLNMYVTLDEIIEFKRTYNNLTLKDFYLLNKNISFQYGIKLKELFPELSLDDLIRFGKEKASLYNAYTIKKIYSEASINDILLLSTKLPLSFILLFKENNPEITFNDLLTIASSFENITYLDDFQKYYPEFNLSELLKIKHVDLEYAVQLKKRFPETTSKDIQDFDKASLNLKELYEFKTIFPETSTSDFIKLGKKHVNLKKALAFKQKYFETTIENLIDITESNLDYQDAYNLKLWNQSLTIDQFCELGRGGFNLKSIFRYLDLYPKTTIEDLISMNKKYREFYIKDFNEPTVQSNTKATIVETDSSFTELRSNRGCFEIVKDRILKVLELVWPSLSEGKKRDLLKMEECNKFLRKESEFYPGFKIIPQTYIPKYLEKFSKNIFNHFSQICKNSINQNNYFDLFKESLNNSLYGPLFASYLKKEPIPEGICHGIKIEISTQSEMQTFYHPEISELPIAFNLKSTPVEFQDYRSIADDVTSSTFANFYKKFRNGSITSKDKRNLTKELASLSPNSQTTLWRSAKTSFGNIPFDDLKETVYNEAAPTSTTWDKNRITDSENIMLIELSPEFMLARTIEKLSHYQNEKEVLLPPNSCFKYLGKKKGSDYGLNKEKDIYHFLFVPWSEKLDYGYYSRELAIFEANKYYGRDFKLARDEITIKNSNDNLLVVKRPNHGLTHGVRQAYLALDLLKHLAKESDKYGDLGTWAKNIVNDNEKKRFVETIFLMTLHFRAARLAETENYFPEYVAHIKKVLQKSQLVTDPREIDRYANLFSEKPMYQTKEDKYVMMLLDVSHRTDHLRQSFWDIEESERDQRYAIGELGEQSIDNQKSIIEFMQSRAEIYLEATGVFNLKKDKTPDKDKVIKGYPFTNPKLFGELENDPKKLYQIMEKLKY